MISSLVAARDQGKNVTVEVDGGQVAMSFCSCSGIRKQLIHRIATIHRFTMSLAKRDPSDFLKTVIGRPVVVKLNSGVDYRGARHARACSMPLLCARPSTCIFWVVLSLSQACSPASTAT